MALHVWAPNESTVTQYIRIFLKYVDDHPELAHHDFDFVALDATAVLWSHAFWSSIISYALDLAGGG
jgi:hypothetical protein